VVVDARVYDCACNWEERVAYALEFVEDVFWDAELLKGGRTEAITSSIAVRYIGGCGGEHDGEQRKDLRRLC
jgi:hypothetical protein